MKKPLLKSLLVPASLFIAGFLAAAANAQTTTSWDGATAGTGTTWNTSVNWVGDSQPPNAADSNVLISDRNGTGTISAQYIGADRTLGLLTFDNVLGKLASTLNVDNNFSTTDAHTLTLHAGITLQNTSTTVVVRGNNGTMTLALGADNVWTTSAGSSLQVTTNVIGAFGITKAGPGTATLNPGSANTYSGGTTVAGGTLRYGRTGSLGTGAVIIGSVGGGDATLENYLAGWTTANNISTVAGSGGTLTLAATGGTNFSSLVSGTVTLNDSLVVRSEAATGFAMRLTGAVSGAGGITKTGAGVLRLENDNAGYSGTTTISTGTLQLGNNGTTGGIGSGTIVNNSTLTVSRSNTLTLNNTMSGTGALVQAGTGTTIISNDANSYSGGTTVASGTLQIGRSSSLGTGLIALGSVGGGNATLENYLAGWTTSNNITTVAGSGGTLTLYYSSGAAFSSTFSGSITLNDNLVMRSDAGAGFAMRITGAISGASNITKTGAGVLRLENNNTGYSGTTTISAGTVQLGNNSSAGGIGTGSIVNNAALVIQRTNALALTNQISGTGSVTQSGTGTTTVSNANTYSGGTTVSGGTLLVTNTTGSATGTGAVNVSSILGGTGTIAPTSSNSVIVSGNVAPGVAGVNNGVGTLSFTPVDGNVTLAAGSSIAFELSGNGSNDKVLFNASGSGVIDFSAMIGSALVVSFVGGYTPALNDSFDLIDWAAVTGSGVNGLNTSLLSLSTAGFDPSWSWDTTQFTATGVIRVVTLVPEPSRALLLGAGMALLMLRRGRGRGRTGCHVFSPK